MSSITPGNVFELICETNDKTHTMVLLKKVLHTFPKIDIQYNNRGTFNIFIGNTLYDNMYTAITTFTFSFDDLIDILSSEVFNGDVRIYAWGCGDLYDERNRECLRAFFEWLSQTQTLKILSLPLISRGISEKSFGLFDAIIVNSSIEHLCLGNSCVDPVDVGLVISSNTTLTNLDLTCCNITDITPIAQALSINSRIATLDLSYNGIENIDSLSKALIINTTLKELHLQFNPIVNLDSFASMLLYNTTLESISIEIEIDDCLMVHSLSQQYRIEMYVTNNRKRNHTLFGLMMKDVDLSIAVSCPVIIGADLD